MGNIVEALDRCIDLADIFQQRTFDDITIQVADEYSVNVDILRHWLYKSLD